MYVRFTNAGRSDFDKLSFSAHLINRSTAEITHARAHAADELMDHSKHAAFEGNTSLHTFGHQLLGIPLGLLEIAVTGTLLHGRE